MASVVLGSRGWENQGFLREGAAHRPPGSQAPPCPSEDQSRGQSVLPVSPQLLGPMRGEVRGQCPGPELPCSPALAAPAACSY